MRVAVKTPSIARLIAVPAVISIAVTALRLVGGSSSTGQSRWLIATFVEKRS
jgi:hypothetical protein